MEKLKFALFSIIIISLVGLIVYWSINTIETGPEHKISQKIELLESENEKLKEEAEDLKNELSFLQSQIDEAEKSAQEVAAQPVEKPSVPAEKPTTTVYKNQTLINELQKLITDGIFLKVGSQGTRVGTVQKFLNIYNKTSNRVDNDYGASTKTAVAAFQKAQGLTADGEAGANTFRKMIDWLKKQV